MVPTSGADDPRETEGDSSVPLRVRNFAVRSFGIRCSHRTPGDDMPAEFEPRNDYSIGRGTTRHGVEWTSRRVESAHSVTDGEAGKMRRAYGQGFQHSFRIELRRRARRCH